MNPHPHEKWRVIDPDYRILSPEYFDTRERAYAEVKRYPWLVVQQRLASGWEAIND